MVQAVVNGRKLFIDVAAGFPGSLHDARVLRNSSIYQKAENGDILAAGPMYLIGADETHFHRGCKNHTLRALGTLVKYDLIKSCPLHE